MSQDWLSMHEGRWSHRKCIAGNRKTTNCQVLPVLFGLLYFSFWYIWAKYCIRVKSETLHLMCCIRIHNWICNRQSVIWSFYKGKPIQIIWKGSSESTQNGSGWRQECIYSSLERVTKFFVFHSFSVFWWLSVFYGSPCFSGSCSNEYCCFHMKF